MASSTWLVCLNCNMSGLLECSKQSPIVDLRWCMGYNSCIWLIGNSHEENTGWCPLLHCDLDMWWSYYWGELGHGEKAIQSGLWGAFFCTAQRSTPQTGHRICVLVLWVAFWVQIQYATGQFGRSGKLNFEHWRSSFSPPIVWGFPWLIWDWALWSGCELVPSSK